MSPQIRVLQLVTTRRSLREWQRDRHVQLFAEIDALRADLARLKRMATHQAVCCRCGCRTTLLLQADGFKFCNRCVAYTKEERA